MLEHRKATPTLRQYLSKHVRLKKIKSARSAGGFMENELFEE